MIRSILCFAFLLQACASHSVRCDAHLLPINEPAKKSAIAEKPVPAQKPAPAGEPAP